MVARRYIIVFHFKVGIMDRVREILLFSCTVLPPICRFSNHNKSRFYKENISTINVYLSWTSDKTLLKCSLPFKKLHDSVHASVNLCLDLYIHTYLVGSHRNVLCLHNSFYIRVATTETFTLQDKFFFLKRKPKLGAFLSWWCWMNLHLKLLTVALCSLHLMLPVKSYSVYSCWREMRKWLITIEITQCPNKQPIMKLLKLVLKKATMRISNYVASEVFK